MAIPQTLSDVPNLTPYIQYVSGSGQTVFPYPFPITQDSDLVVVINGVTQATDGGYTLSGQGNDTGGNLTFTLGQTAGTIVTLFRDISIQRITQISQNSGFSSTAFNAEYNNVYLILQQLEAQIALCLQIPNTNNPAPTTILTPATYANKYQAYDANGNPTPAAAIAVTTLTQALIGGLLYPQIAAETSAGLTVVDDTIPSPDKTGLAMSARYLSVSQRTNTSECSAVLNAIGTLCATNSWMFWCDPADRYKTTSNVTFTFPAQVSMNGARIVANTGSWVTGTSAVTIVGDNESSAGGYQAGLFMQIAVQGPNGGEGNGVPVANSLATLASNGGSIDGIVINPSSTQQITDCNLQLWVEGFRDGIVVEGQNWYIFRFLYPHVTKNWRNGWNLSLTSNAGENISIIGGITANNTNGGTGGGAAPGNAVGMLISGANAPVGITEEGHSNDYNDIPYSMSGGNLRKIGGHIENGAASGSQGVNTGPFFVLSSTSGQPPTELHLIGVEIAPTEPATGRAAFVSSTGSTVVTARDCKLFTFGLVSTAFVNVVSGTPQMIQVDGWTDTAGGTLQGVMPTICAPLLNKLFNAVNPAASTFSGWTQNGSSGITWSNASSTAQAVVTGASAGSQSQNVRVVPGELYNVQAKTNVTAISAGYAAVSYAFYTLGAVQISTGQFNTVNSITNTSSGGTVSAPAGADYMVVAIGFQGFTGTVQFSNVVVERTAR